MPFINLKTNVKIDEEKEEKIKNGFGKAISVLPGKSEAWLMLNFEDGCRLYFKGDNSRPLAFVEVKVYGTLQEKSCNNLTKEISDIIEKELSIKKDGIYVKYEEVEYWGFNGANF